MSKNKQRGFTLIELLVVIAIIGILSSVVLASLNTARAKARDSRRISDMKEIQKAIALIDTTGANDFVGCTGADAIVSTCTTPDLSKYIDPSGNVTTACTSASAGTCAYVVNNEATANVGNYEICFYMEQPSNFNTTAGPLNLTASGITSGCTAE